MLEIASQMIICLLLAALLGFIIGYLFGKLTCAKDSCYEDNNGAHQESFTQTESSTEGHAISNKSTQTAADTLKSTEQNAPKESSQTQHKTATQKDFANTAKEETETPNLKTNSNMTTKNKSVSTEVHSDTEQKTVSNDSVQNGDIDNNRQMTQPELLSQPRLGKADNLTKIKGIGIKLEEVLNQTGIYHFDQIAAWTPEHIAWADSTLGFPGRVKREEWIEQAKILASGKETEFSKRVSAGEVNSSKQD